MAHLGFWWEMAAKIGPPVIAGTLVAALTKDEFGLMHAALIALGLALMLLAHWREHSE